MCTSQLTHRHRFTHGDTSCGFISIGVRIMELPWQDRDPFLKDILKSLSSWKGSMDCRIDSLSESVHIQSGYHLLARASRESAKGLCYALRALQISGVDD